MSAVLSPTPAVSLSPKVVIRDGLMAVVATDHGDRFVKVGSIVTMGGELLRVDAITRPRSAWTVDTRLAA